MHTIEKLKEICVKATPAPWYFSNHEEITDIYHDDGHDTTYIIKETSEAIEDEDAIFVVTARQALPLLIELVEAYEMEIKALRDILEHCEIMTPAISLRHEVSQAWAKLESLEV